MGNGTVKFAGYKGTTGHGMKNKRNAKTAAIRKEADAKKRRMEEAKQRREDFDYDWQEDS